MNIKRFHAATSREALAKARMAFGDGTLILSNRATANGVEVVATAEDSLHTLESDDFGSGAQPQVQPQMQPQKQQRQAMAEPAYQARPAFEDEIPAAPSRKPAARQSVEDDTEQLAMSTLSFQDYVRERMLRRRHEAMHGSDAPPPPAAAPARAPSKAQAPMAAEPARSSSFGHRARDMAAERGREMRPTAASMSAPTPAPAPLRARSSAPVAEPQPPASAQGMMAELQSMRDLIEDRFNALTWLGQARQNPVQTNLMLKLIRAGYSPALSRAVLERLPDDVPAADAVRWLMDVLERNLKTDARATSLRDEGGIFALVGATGVGKTTTAAKLAALCARQHGPASVGLISLDTYRLGAHEQLRNFGRMLGVVAHLAHDGAALQDLLSLLSGKRLVLIDTSGMAPRDPRKSEMLELIDMPEIKRLMVLNASSHGDTLDDTLDAFKGTAPAQAILTKTDEAVKLGPAIDALIRHQVTLRGVTNGQRVPEDWEMADAQQLVAASMRAPTKSAFDPKSTELNFFFSSMSERGAGHV